MEKVTCFYCEYFDCLYKMEYPDFKLVNFGLCNHIENCRHINDDICNNFKLRQGLHTKKWYPSK